MKYGKIHPRRQSTKKCDESGSSFQDICIIWCKNKINLWVKIEKRDCRTRNLSELKTQSQRKEKNEQENKWRKLIQAVVDIFGRIVRKSAEWNGIHSEKRPMKTSVNTRTEENEINLGNNQTIL